MGPFAVNDLAGNDVGWRIRKGKGKNYYKGKKYASTVADRLCEQGRFGQKVGKGFYKYDPQTRKRESDPAVAKIIEEVRGESEGLRAALSPEAKMIKLSTIMPVAFDVNDIRVLSFTLEITITDEGSARVMQSALPLFQETTVKTIEKFLAKKFYNDILYVKEKLGKRLQIAYNKKIDSDGRIKKIKFEDFVIQ